MYMDLDSQSEIFSINSCYSWLIFGGIKNNSFQITWTATIPLKIKIFLWLVKQNKILTKDNLRKRGWIGNNTCVFCNEIETVDHLFLHCSITICIWTWITGYNNLNFQICTIEELWYLDYNIPYKDSNLCEIVRGAVLWTIWNERNKIIF
jgi:zinc-binding in reverse transcriptase